MDECDQGGNCLYETDVECSAPLNECDGGQTCDPSTGTCVDNADAPPETACDMDGDACTVDQCDGGGACVFVSDVECLSPVNECDGGQSCNPMTGECIDNPDAPAEAPCDLDGNACTLDTCDGSGSCVPNGLVECAASTGVCDGGQGCDPTTGECLDNTDAPEGTACDLDKNLCTQDTCDGAGACVAGPECEVLPVCVPQIGCDLPGPP